ncbi:hypothetical protein B0H11DRAFT_2297925 [Mycena galericulata]|nr:hypothetical protein B0H11DRAFT_2297925 [Mycena galericulata]
MSIRLLPLVFLSGQLTSASGPLTRPSVYRSQPPAEPATVPQSVGDGGRWNYTGCYTDSVSNRVLPEKADVDGGMTVEKCTSACQAKGFPFAGTEYAKGTPSLSFLSYDLWCGDRLDSAPASGCDMACTGDGSQNCGGGNRLSVFHDSSESTMPVGTTCVDRTTEEDFTLQAVFRDGSPPVYLLVTHSTTSTAVITSCTNCSTPYISYSLYEGAFYAEADTNPAIAVSPPLAAGDIITLSTVEHETFTGYCTVTSGDATLLAGNNRSDCWALCPNAAANGRMEVV